jgi:hypothetical protein
MKNALTHNQNPRCPYCKYAPDGTLAKYCIDCHDEVYEPDDALYDLALGDGACETCGAEPMGKQISVLFTGSMPSPEGAKE